MKRIFFLTLIVLGVCITSYAANPEVLDSSVYYAESVFLNSSGDELELIESGDITCRYSVINSADESESYCVICGFYEDGILKSVSSETTQLAPLGCEMFEFVISVPSDSENPEIRAFLVRNPGVRTPLKSISVLSQKSNGAYVSSLSVNGIEADIDNNSNLIEVSIPKGSSVNGIEADVEVSSGATFTISGTDWESGENITVVSENGTVKNYVVRTVNEPRSVVFDFEDYESGKSLTDYDKTAWGLSDNESDYSTLVTDYEDGKILVLYDDSLTVKTNARLNDVLNCSVPFRTTLKVKYDLPDGVSKRTAEDDFSYSPFYVRNGGSANMCGFQTAYTNNKFWFHYMENGSTSKRSEIEVIPGEWYDVEMYYYLADDGKYYTDYTFTGSDSIAHKISKVASPSEYNEATRYYFSTSNGRKCVISYDDISIEETGSKTDYNIDFDDGETNGFTGCQIAYCDAFESDALFVEETASLDMDTKLTAQIGFRFHADSFSDSANIFTLCSDSDMTFSYNEGKLCYSLGEEEFATDSFLPESAGVYDFKIKCVYDEIYENYRVDIYVDNILIANIPYMSQTGSITGIRFYNSGSDTYVDDFCMNN